MSAASQQPTITSINPYTHLRNRFARRFIRALNNTKTTTGAAYDHNDQIYQRSCRVKIAAYTAMASVVGSRRAWSRALLWKMRNRSRNRGFGFLFLLRKRKLRRTTTRNNKITTHHHHAKVVSVIKRRNTPFSKRSKDDDLMGEEYYWKLRKVVPGGETMDSWPILMDEAADYINCLAAQVDVMKTLLHRYTATTCVS